MSNFYTSVVAGHKAASPSGFYPQIRLHLSEHRDPVILWQGDVPLVTQHTALQVAENQMIDRLTELFRPTTSMTRRLMLDNRVQ